MLTSCYPVLCTADVVRSSRFWTTWFDFTTTFEADWYVSLERRVGDRSFELGLVAADHSTVPAGYRTPARGLLVNMEVDDVDAQWRRLIVDGKLEPALSLRTEDFGQRHFIVPGPDGVLVDVITNVPASAEYSALYR